MTNFAPPTTAPAQAQGRLHVGQLQWLILAGATLLAAALRFYKLGEWSFWGDEIISIRDAGAAFAQPAANSQLTFYLMGAAMAWLGVDEWSARLVPALIGIASIPILFFPIRRMMGTAVALVAVVLLALSPWHLYWSQNARFYVTLLLFYTLALITFYFWLEEDRFVYLLVMLACSYIAVSERLIALFLGPVTLLYMAGLLILPVPKPVGLRPRNVLLYGGAALAGGAWFAVPVLLNWSEWLRTFGHVNNNPFWILAGTTFYMRLPVICLAFAGALYLLAQRRRAGLLLSLSAAVPTLAIAAISLIHYAANRYAFVALTAVIILASVAAVEVWRTSTRSGRALAAGILLLLLLDPVAENLLYYRYQNGNRDDWRAALEYVQARRQPGEVVVAGDADVGTFYLGAKSSGLIDFDPARWDLSHPIWFVVDMSGAERYPEQLAWVQQHALQVAEFDVHLQARNFIMRVYHYTPEAQSLEAIRDHISTGAERQALDSPGSD